MRMTILAIGSRGDVQPLVALGKGLKNAGHRVTVASHLANEKFIKEHGLKFAPIHFDFKKFFQQKLKHAALDPKANPFKTFADLIRIIKVVKPIADSIWKDCLKACEKTEVILSVPILPGFHIAEKKGIPCFNLGFYPLSRTDDFPCPLMPFQWDFGRIFNKMTYEMVDQSAWLVGRRIINDWRKKSGLPAIRYKTYFNYLDNKKAPFLYGFSAAFLPRPKKWPKWIHVTGYWFLGTPKKWKPPKALADFLGKGEPPVCIGFGSIPAKETKKLTKIAIDALKLSGQRGILLSGWSDFGKKKLPDTIYCIESVPHEWLFSKMKAIIHHGGAGTTAAAIRSGVPSMAIPFMGDQLFWGRQIEKEGVGPAPITMRNLTAKTLAGAILKMVSDKSMQKKAAALGKRIRSEDGAENAAKIINRYLKSR